MTGPRSRGHTILAVVSLLVIGAAAGITADRMLHRRPVHGGLDPAEVHSDPVGVLDRELDLRPEQRARVAEILGGRQSSIDRVWVETNTRFRATVDSVVAEVSAVLDPPQAARFRELIEELHATPRRVTPHR
jgi:hypothetical protein